MYEYFKGLVTKITANYIVLELNGIGYILNVANPYAYSDDLQKTVVIYSHQVVREDSETLYGFKEESEKQLFLRLISVSGIGPTSALAIIAADDNEGLVNAIDNSDIKYLTKFPKIGKKTAQQMILDLQGKFVAADSLKQAKRSGANSQENVALEEAMEALLALGYKAKELKKVKSFFEGSHDTAENYIKKALKMLVTK